MSDFSDWEVIDTYSTKQAVEDGFLVLVDQKILKKQVLSIRFT
jgi:type I site-specific restriction endonuclease